LYLKGLLKKTASSICILSLLATSTTGFVLADTQTTLSPTLSINTSLEKTNPATLTAPTGKQSSESDFYSSVYVKSGEEIQNTVAPLGAISGNQAASGEASQEYTMADLNKLNYSDLVDLLVTIHKDDITDLFKYNTGAHTFYMNQERLQAIRDAIVTRGPLYTETNHQGIPTLVEVLRAGYFLGFNNSQLGYLNTAAEKEKCLPAITALQANPNFGFTNNTTAQIVSSAGYLIDASTCTPEMINKFTPVFQEYYANIDTYLNNDDNRDHKLKGDALFNTLTGINLILSNSIIGIGDEASDTQWFGKIDGFLAEVAKLAVLDDINDNNTWLINNGIYITGKLGAFNSDPTKGNKALTDSLAMYPHLGAQYLQAAYLIKEQYNSVDYYGNVLDYDGIIAEGKAFYQPNTYTFDEGKIIVKAGANVTEEKIKRLYWASNEVRAQVYRLYGRDLPLEEGHTDEVLTVVLYNSPAEYKANNFLYGYDTNNGGMYIESEGTFYTYERTPQESIYTLEELFRHEFTHYLQGRYIVPGMWGATELYKDSRLLWYEEGGAELLAGSTRTDGVLDRSTMVGKLRSDLSTRYSLSKILNVKSYSSDVYTYGYTFMSYMYQNRLDIFNRLAELVRNDDVAGFDAYIAQLSNDSALNTQYQNYMQALYDHRDDYTLPLVADDYITIHPNRTLSQIRSDITSVSRLSNVTVEDTRSQFFNTFTLKGTYTGSYYKGEARDTEDMKALADGFLDTLSGYSWSGYKTLTCYFTNYRQDSRMNMQFDVVFHGVLTEYIPNESPTADITIPFAGVKNEAMVFKGDNSVDPDGMIANYSWNFGDGTTSNAKNPEHTYAEVGSYNVSLTVTDSDGVTNTENKLVRVSLYPQPITEEYENNNEFDRANKGVTANIAIAGTLDSTDSTDNFIIDVLSPGTLDIALTNSNDSSINWILYDGSDTTKRIMEASRNGKDYSRSCEIQPGRYYLTAYKCGDENSAYSLTVNGPIQTQTQQDEIERNDDFSEAQGAISFDIPLKGSFSETDYNDTFFFNVTEAATIDISVKNSGAVNMNWILFKAPDTSNYVSYAKTSGTDLTGSYDAQPGKYNLRVYKISGTSDNYELTLTKRN